ncbi:MAG TPA: acetyl-CoA carboxylase biotin carboxyl carrier protein [Rhizomicrobium sp.]|jgi:acetyl-CoA carboxylase biotin carboxyl carrier protein|nr:acetyl-CoA carboxylase biotin carboxyl carrier protein [Rhizomicrobium sp.]
MSSKKKKPAAKSAAKPEAMPAGKSETRPGVDAAAVRELAKLLKETGLTEIEIEHQGARIRVSRSGGVAAPAAAAPAPVAATPAPAATQPSPSGPPAGAVPSPMVGTVYISPEPGKPAFIAVGKTVKEGDTLFIVEAMKTMNAITAPKGGTVKEISVTDGTPVEFGQTLCVIA